MKHFRFLVVALALQFVSFGSFVSAIPHSLELANGDTGNAVASQAGGGGGEYPSSGVELLSRVPMSDFGGSDVGAI